MKKTLQLFFFLSVCALLPNFCGCMKKCPSKKTAKTVEQEVDVQKTDIKKDVKPPKTIAEIDIDDLDELE